LIYTSNNWNYLGSWKETDRLRNYWIYSFHCNYFPEWISEFDNKYVKLKFDINVEYRRYSIVEKYNIVYDTPRSLMHHDYVIGNYITTSLFWNNEELSNLRQNYNGISLLWYERFGSIEPIVKTWWTIWFALEYIEFVDSIDIYNNILKLHNSLNANVLEARWIWYNSLYELEDNGWSRMGFWEGQPNLFIRGFPDSVFYGEEDYEWINKNYYAVRQEDFE
jgi:hypothetical protein